MDSSQKQIKLLVTTLESLGYYRYSTPEETAIAKSEAIGGGDLFADETHRVFFVDAEEIFESGANRTISELSPSMRKFGCPIHSYDEEFEQGRFVKGVLNHSEFLIWCQEDPRGSGEWELPTLRVLRALNAALARAGSYERVFYDVIGNDTKVVFLTHEIHREILRSGLVETRRVDLLKSP